MIITVLLTHSDTRIYLDLLDDKLVLKEVYFPLPQGCACPTAHSCEQDMKAVQGQPMQKDTMPLLRASLPHQP